jgi:4a-hydroxytetrahydrobiopterin dehydratase
MCAAVTAKKGHEKEGKKEEDLASMSCADDTRALTSMEISELKPKVSTWSIVKGTDRIDHLEKVFKFKDFREALSFTNKVGELAETEEHHPAILTEYGKVTVMWWTHTAKGLTQNDFIMAAKMDKKALG